MWMAKRERQEGDCWCGSAFSTSTWSTTWNRPQTESPSAFRLKWHTTSCETRSRGPLKGATHFSLCGIWLLCTFFPFHDFYYFVLTHFSSDCPQDHGSSSSATECRPCSGHIPFFTTPFIYWNPLTGITTTPTPALIHREVRKCRDQ